jgi:hypothetical protein
VNGKDDGAARDVKKAIVTQYGGDEVVGSVTPSTLSKLSRYATSIHAKSR